MQRNKVAGKQFCCGNTAGLDQSPPKMPMQPVKAQHRRYVWCMWVLRYQPSKVSVCPRVAQLCWQRVTVGARRQHGRWDGEGVFEFIRMQVYSASKTPFFFFFSPECCFPEALLCSCHDVSQLLKKPKLSWTPENTQWGLQCNSSLDHPSVESFFWTVATWPPVKVQEEGLAL